MDWAPRTAAPERRWPSPEAERRTAPPRHGLGLWIAVSVAWGEGDDAERRTAVALGVFTDCGGEAEGVAAAGEGVGLSPRPAVTGETVGAVGDVTLDGHEPAARRQDAADLTERGVNVGPVVDGGQ